jgi:glycosyltransferase involved in cell wall biosynthesis
VEVVALGYGLAESREGRAFVRAGGRLAPDIDPEWIYEAADVFVQTSAWEGTPLSVLEAMRAGLPVVAYDVGGLADLVIDGDTGYLVPPASLGQLARRIIGLFRSRTELLRLGEASRQRYDARFSYDRMVEAMIEIYLGVVRNVRAS